MERGGHEASLSHEHRVLVMIGEYFDVGPHSPNDRGANEHHLDRSLAKSGAGLVSNVAFQLSPVAVPFDGEVQEAERLLLR